MAITQTLTDTFLQDCLDGGHNLGNGGDTLKIALYTSSASLGATTSAYTTSITARGALIYNNSKSNASIAVLDFGSDFTSTAGTFTIQLPSAAHNTAIIRIS
jgi:hypothetical protein